MPRKEEEEEKLWGNLGAEEWRSDAIERVESVLQCLEAQWGRRLKIGSERTEEGKVRLAIQTFATILLLLDFV